ncbi:hypothetical protein KL919_005278 [Ogataea angusta]|nr:hypothetical protein KL919_005278 [Ogataea angusta]
MPATRLEYQLLIPYTQAQPILPDIRLAPRAQHDVDAQAAQPRLVRKPHHRQNGSDEHTDHRTLHSENHALEHRIANVVLGAVDTVHQSRNGDYQVSNHNHSHRLASGKPHVHDGGAAGPRDRAHRADGPVRHKPVKLPSAAVHGDGHDVSVPSVVGLV